MTTIEKVKELWHNHSICTKCVVSVDGDFTPLEDFNANDIIRFAADFHESQSKWISVEDGLPEKEGQYYLVFTTEKRIVKAWFMEAHFYEDDINAGTTTHWMPLPEPPK